MTDRTTGDRSVRRPLKVGLFVDAIGLTTPDGRTRRWSEILAFARAAEDAGFDSLWVPDHLLPWPAKEGVWECWSLVAALAAATRRIELGTFVLCTGFRNPALLAKMADAVDEISGGRLILGLGAGNTELEHRAFGYPFDQRASRFEEALRIISTLLREGRVDVAGRFYQARACELRPRGPRAQGPPILVGAKGERMLRLTARWADLWNGLLINGRNHPDEVPPLRAAVDAGCREAGRDPASLGRTITVLVDVNNPAPVFGPSFTRAEPIRGSSEEIAQRLRGFADVGISHVQVLVPASTAAAVEAFAPVLELLDRA
jgi:alkanesulfonate monooxygenase SsuD/methylene tetrahydromethanopterin reductase-like flavin-dependent oxidoreductase (luciferase family)